MRLTIAIPAYDEAQNLERVVVEARAAAAAACPADSEILIVDDGSLDGTAEVASRLAARWPDVRLVTHPRNRGFSGAMATCFRRSSGDRIFLASADGQTDMDLLGAFLEAGESADVVVGIRVERTEGLRRKILSRAFHALARGLFALPEREFSSTFLFRRSLLESMPFRARDRSAAILPEVLFRTRRRGARIATIAVVPRARWAGRAKGGQLSVALVTGLELIRVAVLARLDERHRAAATSLGPAADPLE